MTLSRSPIKKGDVSSWNFPSFAESTSIDIEIGNVKVPTAGDLEKLQEHKNKVIKDNCIKKESIDRMYENKTT